MPMIKSPMPKFSFVWFTVLNCHRVICQTSSKVDQLQAHPPNNGAGWGDRDPAPSAPLVDHLPPSFLSRCRKARAAVHTEQSSAKCNGPPFPPLFQFGVTEAGAAPVWHLSLSPHPTQNVLANVCWSKAIPY